TAVTSSNSASSTSAISFNLKLKVEPTPNSDSTSNLPPCNSTNCLVTFKPIPVPPICLEEEESTCLKGSKIPSCFSKAIPEPVSETHILNSSSSCSVVTVTSPYSVNSIAFPTKLYIIC